MILTVLEVEVGIKNQSKIDLNLGSPLGIDFSWILMDFGRFSEAKLASSWLQNRSQEASKKGCQKVGISDRILGRLGGISGGSGRGRHRSGSRISGPLRKVGRYRGAVTPRPGARFRPPKEGRFCGEGGICGEVSRVEVGRLRRKPRNAVRARRGGGLVFY